MEAQRKVDKQWHPWKTNRTETSFSLSLPLSLPLTYICSHCWVWQYQLMHSGPTLWRQPCHSYGVRQALHSRVMWQKYPAFSCTRCHCMCLCVCVCVWDRGMKMCCALQLWQKWQVRVCADVTAQTRQLFVWKTHNTAATPVLASILTQLYKI